MPNANLKLYIFHVITNVFTFIAVTHSEADFTICALTFELKVHFYCPRRVFWPDCVFGVAAAPMKLCCCGGGFLA